VSNIARWTTNPRVAIFGATSAIAAEIARVYAGRGARLFLAGRDPAKLRALVEARGDAVAGFREVDLTAPGAAAAAVSAAIEALGGGLDVAVIAHGWLGDQLASERDVAEAERIIATNFVSVVALLVPLGNHFERAGAGQYRGAVVGGGGSRPPAQLHLRRVEGRAQPLSAGAAHPPVGARRRRSHVEAGARRHAHDRDAREDDAIRARRPGRRRHRRGDRRRARRGLRALVLALHHGDRPQHAGTRDAAAAGAVGR
jgi:hypothetical protein